MTRFFGVVLVVLLTACGKGKSSQVVLPPDGIALDSTGAIKRHYLADSLVLVSQLGGGSDRDTALIDPYLIEAAGNQVFLVEGDQRVQAYDTLANRLWAFGRDGGGPGEFRNIRDIKLAPNGEIWINDPPNARITRISTQGKRVGFISLQHAGYSETMIPGPGATATLLPPSAESDILTIDTTGAVVDRDTVPWSGFHQLEHLSRQFRTANDPATGRWTMGFIFGNGWFAFEGHGGSDRRFYVEPTSFPGIVKEITNGGATVSSKLMRGDLSASAIAMQADTFFVLFGGKKEDFRQKIDLYSWSSGRYLGSIALPSPVDDIALTGSYLFTLNSHPVPKLAVYRRVRKS